MSTEQLTKMQEAFSFQYWGNQYMNGEEVRKALTAALALSPDRDAYRPCIIRYEDAGISELVLADVATITGHEVIVEAVYDMTSRELIGFKWWGVGDPPAAPDRAEIERLREEIAGARFTLSKSADMPLGSKTLDELAGARWDECQELRAENEKLRAALKPFSEAGTATKNLLDWQGDHEVILSFGPAPIGVIPLSAFEAAREAYGHD